MVDQAKGKYQAPTNWLNLDVTAIIEFEAWPTVVQLKKKP